MTPIQSLVAIVGVLVSLSVASERLVEIIKGLIPFLNLQNADEKDEKKEGRRKAILQAMAVCSGIVTALLAKPALADILPNAWTSLPAIFALGFLASGGSGLWNAVLSYVLLVKNIKKEKFKQLQKQSR
jgi:hypothetical protein